MKDKIDNMSEQMVKDILKQLVDFRYSDCIKDDIDIAIDNIREDKNKEVEFIKIPRFFTQERVITEDFGDLRLNMGYMQMSADNYISKEELETFETENGTFQEITKNAISDYTENLETAARQAAMLTLETTYIHKLKEQRFDDINLMRYKIEVIKTDERVTDEDYNKIKALIEKELN